MPSYKNQHYVPESYLKGWSDDKELPIYLIEPEREIPSEPISRLCSRSYFNSEETFIEPVLGKLEGAHADAFNSLRTGESLRSLSVGGQRLLLSFVFTQRQRTRLMRDEIRASSEDYFREGIREDVAEAGYDPDQYTDLEDAQFKRTVQRSHHFMMMHGILAPIGMHELACVVLENETDINFITSEAPVVFANPRFKEDRELAYAGMANAGLQVYCPLSPQLCLLFYDPRTYFVEANRDWHVSLTRSRDIRELNLLQVLNTDSFVLYETPGQETMMAELVDEARDFENWQMVSQPFPDRTKTDSEYPYEPPHQLHDLTPTPKAVSIRTGVEFHQREQAFERQRYVVWRLLERTETTEEALLQAVVFMLNDAGKEFGIAES